MIKKSQSPDSLTLVRDFDLSVQSMSFLLQYTLFLLFHLIHQKYNLTLLNKKIMIFKVLRLFVSDFESSIIYRSSGSVHLGCIPFGTEVRAFALKCIRYKCNPEWNAHCCNNKHINPSLKFPQYIITYNKLVYLHYQLLLH